MAKQSTQTIKRYLERHRQHVAPVERDEIFGLDPALDVIDGVVERLIGGVGLADRGLLFSGLPGTGKTLSARYLATRLGRLTEQEIPFYVLPLDGLTPELVRGVFAYLDAQPGPSIIYLDEIDGFARKIDVTSSQGEPPADRALRLAFLSALDGTLDGQHRALLIASTNLYPVEIHPALLRSGRLGRHLVYDRPKPEAVAKILSHHLAGKTDLSAQEISFFAKVNRNSLSGADCRSISEDAIARATLGNRRVEFEDLVVALRARGGRRADQDLVAKPVIAHETIVHELGHAVVASVLRGAETVESIVFIDFYEAKTHHSDIEKEDDELKAAVILRAGRIAEEIIVGRVHFASERDFVDYHKSFVRLMRNGRWSYLAAVFDVGSAKPHPNGHLIQIADGLNAPFAGEVAALWRDFDRWVDQAARAILVPHRGLIEAIAADLVGRIGVATEEWLALLAKHGPLQAIGLPPLPASLAVGAPGSVPLD